MRRSGFSRFRNRTRRPGCQRGAEIVEFLITLPVILIVLAIFVDYGMVFCNQSILTDAVRSASLEAIHGGTDAEAQQAADQISQSLLARPSGDPLPVISVVRAGTDPGDAVTVTITYAMDFLLLPRFLSAYANINLSATAVMNMLPT